MTLDTPEPARDGVAPVTGHAAIDEALSGLTLGPDVHTHHDALAATLEAVQRALNPPSRPPAPPR